MSSTRVTRSCLHGCGAAAIMMGKASTVEGSLAASSGGEAAKQHAVIR